MIRSNIRLHLVTTLRAVADSTVLRLVLPALIAAGLLLGAPAGCGNAMGRIDREVDALLLDTSRGMGESIAPTIDADSDGGWPAGAFTDRNEEHPPTVNPVAGQLDFVGRPEEEAETLIARLQSYSEVPADTRTLDLPSAMVFAIWNSREFRFAEEEYLLVALRLLVERHRWGPRFFDDVSAEFTADGDSGNYNSALRVINDFEVTQRLPYGGQVSARALTVAVQDLHDRVASPDSSQTDIILSADIPLLRGAGIVAREDLIQHERDMVYAAREFARFRREFLFDIASDYLNLIVRMRQVENARLRVDNFRKLEVQQEALYDLGRIDTTVLAEAKNDTLDSIAGLNGTAEVYRLALDRFKVRIGMGVEEYLQITDKGLDLETPDVTMGGAVRAAMAYRLDVQSERDRVDDARRGVEVARNQILGQLDISASVNLPTDRDRGRQGLRFKAEDMEYRAGITYGLPLDREIERLNLRQSEISLARTIRSYDAFRDGVAVDVRAAVRGIDTATFGLQLQEDNLEIALRRQASIDANPDRADIRQKTDAIRAISSALDSRDSAARNLLVAILRYLLDTGQLRVDAGGHLEPLPGMTVGDGEERDQQAVPGDPAPKTGVPPAPGKPPGGQGVTSPPGGSDPSANDDVDPSEGDA